MKEKPSQPKEPIDDVQHTKLVDMDWWYVSRVYDTEEDARAEYLKIMDWADLMKGTLELGGYRLLDDLPKNGGQPRLIVILGTIEKHVHEAAEKLDGNELIMPPQHVQGLIARRVRFMVNSMDLNAPPGVYSNEYGPGGLRVNEAGEVIPHD